MDYHDIDMKGTFIGQRVSGLPVWSSEYIAREIYNNLDGNRYYGGLTGWIQYKDGKLLISSNDTTPGYLEDKIIAGDGISISTLNDGLNETLNIESYYTPTENYLVAYNSNDQLASTGDEWNDVTFTTTSKSNGLSLSGGTEVTLTANVKYNISYNIVYVKTDGSPWGFARFTASGDTSWDLETISEGAHESDDNDYFTLSYSTIIIPSVSTVIKVQAKTQSGSQDAKIILASLSIWT